MSRVFLIVLSFGLVLASDLFVDVHHEAVHQAVLENNLDRAVFAYENPVFQHVLHWFEGCLFGVLLLVALLSFWRRFSRCGLGQCLWGLGTVILALSLGLGLFLDTITNGVESQLGLNSLSFIESTHVSSALELAAVLGVAFLALIGPPRGWSADAQAS